MKTLQVIAILLILIAAGTEPVASQTSPLAAERPQRVIDVHWHLPGNETIDESLRIMKGLNVTGAVAIGTELRLGSLKSPGDLTIWPSLTFPCENGKMVNIGTQCFENGSILPDLSKLRQTIKQGDIKALGEINAQYLGIAPNDPRLEPFYALAEELDVPVGIHLGIGPPGAAYNKPGFPPVKSPNYRGVAGDPLLLEDVLIQHPKLRIYAMHAAYPFGDQIVYMLYMHPQLFVDVSVLQWAIPRPAYYAYLKRLIDAGYGKRIMFGSDGNTEKLKDGIEAILKADFLSPDQKSDILYNNAARFFRLQN